MTTRNLDALFAPRAIALVGASRAAGSVGDLVARNLIEGGFAGRLMPVNPHAAEIRGLPCVPNVAALPERPDLAVIATPADSVPDVVAELGARGCRAAIVIGAGFETDGRSAELRAAMLAAARPHLLRILGPNCLGMISPQARVNASFAVGMPPAGRVALVAQSGAVAAAAMDRAPDHGIGFSHVVSVGDCADIDVADVLDYLALDRGTDAILLYLEGVDDARKFMSAARVAGRLKPGAVLKAGRSASGAKAALTHTGALAGAFTVYEAALRRAGLLQVDSLRDLLLAGAAFAGGLTTAGDRLAILTNGGGAGVLAGDALDALGERPVELSAETKAALGAIAPANWSHGDPVDILGDARPELYRDALAALLAAPEVDGVLVLNCPTAVADSASAADAVVHAVRAAPEPAKPVLAGWLGGSRTAPARERLSAGRLPAYDAPEDAARAYAQLTRLRRNRELLLHAPPHPAPPVETEVARRIIAQAVAEGLTVLTDPQARAVLQAYGVPVVASLEVTTPAAAGEAARALGGAVVLKILSRDISHKSDVGGIRLNLQGVAATETAANEMLAAVRAARPNAAIDGFVVEPMIDRPEAEEILAGVVQDPTFGPVVMVGHGGVAVQVLADRALGLPPLDAELAREMIQRTQVSRLLLGYRNRKPADLEALGEVLIALGRLATDLPEIAELDINPLLCDSQGVIAVDARIGVRAAGAAATRAAIVPYPAHLAREVELAGARLRIRPIRPDDAAALEGMIEACAPDDLQYRFSGAVRRLSPEELQALTQLDYDRQMAFVAEAPDGALLGVGRLASDPEGRRAEFALLVRSDRQHHGIGGALLGAVLDHARARGLAEVWGDTTRDNGHMLELARSLGFETHAAADPTEVHMVMPLTRQPEPV